MENIFDFNNSEKVSFSLRSFAVQVDGKKLLFAWDEKSQKFHQQYISEKWRSSWKSILDESIPASAGRIEYIKKA